MSVKLYIYIHVPRRTRMDTQRYKEMCICASNTRTNTHTNTHARAHTHTHKPGRCRRRATSARKAQTRARVLAVPVQAVVSGCACQRWPHPPAAALTKEAGSSMAAVLSVSPLHCVSDVQSIGATPVQRTSAAAGCACAEASDIGGAVVVPRTHASTSAVRLCALARAAGQNSGSGTPPAISLRTLMPVWWECDSRVREESVNGRGKERGEKTTRLGRNETAGREDKRSAREPQAREAGRAEQVRQSERMMCDSARNSS